MSEKDRKRRRNQGGGLLLTPLIDIIFLVALFFIINTSLRQERFLDVSLPASETALEQEAQGLLLVLRKDGSLAMDGKEIPWESLIASLSLAAGEQDTRQVIIQGDQEVSYGHIISLLDRIKKAGLEGITLQAAEPKP